MEFILLNILIIFYKYMIVPYPISLNNDTKKNKQMQTITFICIFSVLLSIIIWYIRFSEPTKIYKTSKLIDPIQYRL